MMWSLLAICFISFVFGDNAAESNLRALNLTQIKDPPSSNGNFINSGTPQKVPLSFDCAAREYAYQYGQQIQPRHGTFVDLFDALQLIACNKTRPIPTPRYIPIFKSTFYIDPINGNNNNLGSKTASFLSIEKSMESTRN